MIFRRIEIKSIVQAINFSKGCGLDTPLGLHSGLHLDKLDAALDHRNLPES